MGEHADTQRKPVSSRLIHGVLVVAIDNPPVNALSVGVRKGLDDAVTQAQHEAEVAAIVVLGVGRHFIAGADIREFGKPPRAPFLRDVCDRIEASTKPVVAALRGSALGGGLEVAMAAHYRMAEADARVGLPEVTLGLLPGAGGTQRAPRLVGAKAALRLMLRGRPVSGVEAAKMGLVDRLAEGGDLEGEVVSYARELVASTTGPRRSREAEGLADRDASRAAIAETRAEQQRRAARLLSPHRIVDAVEAALDLPFSEGVAFEHKLFDECMKSPQRAGFIHAFLAEREAPKVPEATAANPRPLRAIGIVGGGTMGTGIAAAALNAGFPVTMVERDAEGVERGCAGVRKIYARMVEKGRISEEQAADRMARFGAGTDYAAFADVDLVIEAAFEDMSVKQAVFAKLEDVCRPATVLASNTSYLDVNQIAKSTSRQEDVIGLHFFSPAHVMKLLEVVVPDSADADVVSTAFTLAKRLRKIPVRAGVCDGFIGNRTLAAYRQAANCMVEDGASPYAVDAAVRHFGFPMGPFEVYDLAGGDINWAMRKRQAPMRDPRARYVEIPDRLCERGWFGQKTGRGWYRYPGGPRSREEDPDVLAIVADERKRVGVKTRSFDQEEIIRRYMAAMVNEGANIVHEGIALRPLDVDVVLLHGYGFPRDKGGPMYYADQVGPAEILADIKQFAPDDPLFWQPSPLLVNLVEEQRPFSSLNQNSGRSADA